MRVLAVVIDAHQNQRAEAVMTVMLRDNGRLREQGSPQRAEEAHRRLRRDQPDQSRVAVVVDTRPLPQLILAIESVMSVLPSSWPLQVFHGRLNEKFLRESEPLRSLLQEGRATLHPIPLALVGANLLDGRRGDGVGGVVSSLDQMEYSRLLVTEGFWRSCWGEHILLFQADTAMCSPTSAASPHIDHFVGKYDLVGAPWCSKHDDPAAAFHPVCAELPSGYCVGNGGFTLRSRSAMIHCTTSFVCGWLEDQFFALHLGIVGGRVADERTGGRFAVETVVPEAHRNFTNAPPLGVHQPHRHLAPSQLQVLYSACPAARQLADADETEGGPSRAH
jgi:hypothetical protein